MEQHGSNRGGVPEQFLPSIRYPCMYRVCIGAGYSHGVQARAQEKGAGNGIPAAEFVTRRTEHKGP